MTSYRNQNGFLLFARDVQRKYGLSLDDATLKAAREWEDLTEDEQLIYSERAISEVWGEVDLTRKFNSAGVSWAHIASEQMHNMEQKQIMILNVEDMITRLDFPEELLQEKFVLCHVNYFYKVDDKIFKPAEIALCEFHLKHGLLRTFHSFIHPGPVELGYRSELKEMEKIHGISLNNSDINFNDNIQEIFSEMMALIKKDNKGKPRPVFTMPDRFNLNHSIGAVEDVLAQFTTTSGKDDVKIKVFHLNLLLYEILKRVDKELALDLESSAQMNYQKCTTWLENDAFSHCKNLSCDFHEEIDLSVSCSLSIVKRWCYTICEHVLTYLSLEPQRGWHIPGDAKWRHIWARTKPSHQTIPTSKRSNVRLSSNHCRKNTQAKQSHQQMQRRNPDMLCSLKPFTIVDHFTGRVTQVNSSSSNPIHGLKAENPGTSSRAAGNESKEGAYAGALKGKDPRPIGSSLSEFPTLKIDAAKKCEVCGCNHGDCSCSTFLNMTKCQKSDHYNPLQKDDTPQFHEFPPLGGKSSGNPWRGRRRK